MISIYICGRCVNIKDLSEELDDYIQRTGVVEVEITEERNLGDGYYPIWSTIYYRHVNKENKDEVINDILNKNWDYKNVNGVYVFGS